MFVLISNLVPRNFHCDNIGSKIQHFGVLQFGELSFNSVIVFYKKVIGEEGHNSEEQW